MVRTSIVFLCLFSFSLLHIWLNGVVAFDFHKVNTIPRFDATQSIICSGDGLTLLRSTNNLQQRDIWYEFSSGTYPSAFNVRMPQHIRYPLLSMETFPNDGAVNCTKIHSSSQEASFLASIVLHDIQLNSQGREHALFLCSPTLKSCDYKLLTCKAGLFSLSSGSTSSLSRYQ